MAKAVGGTREYPVIFDERPQQEHPFSRNLVYPVKPIPDWIPEGAPLEFVANFFIDGEFREPNHLDNWSA
jgi:hypothetical protein